MSRSPAPKGSPLVRALLATGVLYFVLDLSAGDRAVVDWVVIAVVAAAIVVNLVQLVRLMYPSRGAGSVWHVLRTVLFWIIGLSNTLWVRPGDAGTWRNWLGWVILALALTDTVVLLRKEKALIRELSAEAPTES